MQRASLTWRCSLSALALSVAGGLMAASPASALRVPTPGDDGIGDPYFPKDGNGGIDVLAYDIHDRYRFKSRKLSGWTRLTVRATHDLSSFNLDFLLPVRRVRIQGVPAAHEKPSKHELRITPATPIAAGEEFRVRVRYAGFPDRIGYLGEKNWLANRTEVITMNEPHMAPWWFPANDHPRDKALVDIHVTVPKRKRVVANGRLIDSTKRDGRRTVHWRADEPMVPYLAFFAAGRFAVDKGRRDGLPWYVAVSKEIPKRARERSMRLMRRSAGVIASLESDLGPYPFSSSGGIVTSLQPGFALENQTRPTYPELWPGALDIVVHEQAHQWFGDSVAVENWRDIWLNEGFATFMEVRYRENHGGRSGQAWLRSLYDDLPAGDSFWDLRIGDPGPGRIFAWPVYLRGAMTVQALRNRVGEEHFWTILTRWLAEQRNGNGSTEEFRALAEEVSGEDLGGFFDAWLFTGSKPADTAANGLGD